MKEESPWCPLFVVLYLGVTSILQERVDASNLSRAVFLSKGRRVDAGILSRAVFLSKRKRVDAGILSPGTLRAYNATNMSVSAAIG